MIIMVTMPRIIMAGRALWPLYLMTLIGDQCFGGPFATTTRISLRLMSDER